MIFSMKKKWPTKWILIGKTYLHAAYRHIHENNKTTSTCISIVDKPDFFYLRLPFGNTTVPEECTTIREAEIYLVNDILRDESWDTTYIKSPHKTYSRMRINIIQRIIFQK